MSDYRVNGTVVAVLGVLLFVSGIVAYSYEETLIDLGFVEVVTYPYRDVGVLMMIGGLAMIVVGVVLAAIMTTKPGMTYGPPIQQAMYSPEPQQYAYSAPHPGGAAYCRRCGRLLPQGSVFCPTCGTKSS